MKLRAWIQIQFHEIFFYSSDIRYVFVDKNLKIVTFLIKAMMNKCENEYLVKNKKSWIFYSPLGLLWASFGPPLGLLSDLKMTAQKSHLFIFNLENVVETLGDSLNPNWHETGRIYLLVIFTLLH